MNYAIETLRIEYYRLKDIIRKMKSTQMVEPNQWNENDIEYTKEKMNQLKSSIELLMQKTMN